MYYNDDMFYSEQEAINNHFAQKKQDFLDFINYQITYDKKITDLTNENNNLKKTNKSLEKKNKDLQKKYDNLKDEFEQLEVNKHILEEEYNLLESDHQVSNYFNENCQCNKKRKISDSKIIEEQSPFINIKELEIKNQELINIFGTIKSIDDIIYLENYDKLRYAYNDKFNKFLKIIPALKKLQSLVGMTNIKTQLLKQICFFIQDLHNEEEMLHTVITGPPGVGKTELGKIIGEVYLNMGLLKNNVFKIVKSSDLIGKYVGHTAPKTEKIIEECMGGVLFIDEAYSLGHEDKVGSFSKECIDTINRALTENKGKFVCIIAGYEQQIEKCFFAVNEGLKRRFPYRYHIDKYNGNELLEIFNRKVRTDGWQIDMSCKEEIKKIFHQENIFPYYGGDMEKLLQYAKVIFSERVRRELKIGKDERILNLEDLQNALTEHLKHTNYIEKENVSRHLYV